VISDQEWIDLAYPGITILTGTKAREKMAYKERKDFAKVHGGMKCIKYLLFGFNLLFFLIGLALIILGAALQTKFSGISHIIGDSELSLDYVLIGIGAIIFIVAFFGCCGAIKENYCMLNTFAVFILFVFILEIGTAVAGIVLKGAIGGRVAQGLETSMAEYEKKNSVQSAWNFIQTQFSCCGAKNASEWFGYLHKKNVVPSSCCKDRPPRVHCGEIENGDWTHINTTPCLSSLENSMKENILNLIIAGVVVAVCQAIGIMLGCYLAKNIRKQYEIIQ